MLPSAGQISTHTLTWSVTLLGIDISELPKISTHTLTWSVTLLNGEDNIKVDFNSHAHVERDLDVVYIWCLLNVMRTYFFI